MFLHHIRLAFRTLFRDKIYAGINVAGLALGIAASVLLLLWVQDELSFDRFHQNGSNIYLVNANFINSGNKMTWETTPGPIGTRGKQEIPAIHDVVRLKRDWNTTIFTHGTREFTDERGSYVDEHFFDVFDFPLIHGNPRKPFPTTQSMVLTETMAKKLFGDEEPLGKTVRLDDKDEFTVSGIVADFPTNSTIRASALYPFARLVERYEANDYWKSLETDWGNYHYHTYLLLDPRATATTVGEQLTGIHAKAQDGANVHYTLQPLTDLHLYARDGQETGMQTVKIFSLTALAILLIACINYVNLATARSAKRAKEVGVRKTTGADRRRLVSQFLTESAVLSVLAVALAFFIMQLTIPFYNMLSGKELSVRLDNPQVTLLTGGVLVVTWLVSGFYPAWVLSAFKPIDVIRGKLAISGGNTTFRKALVVTQFALSAIIIIGTLVVGNQLHYIRTKSLGFDKENVFTFGLGGDMFKNIEGVRDALKQDPSVTDVSFANQNLMSIGSSTGDTDWEGKNPDEGFIIHPMGVDETFFKTLNLELVQGRGFTGSPADSAHVILNETTVKNAGITDPVGKTFTLFQTKATIIGVVKDFHHSSVRKKIEPTAFFHTKNWVWLVYVKTTDPARAVATAEKLWKKYNSKYPFHYNFMDAEFDKMYRSEARMEKLFYAFSIIAICISCLGLFGLVTFTASQRIKEISIRKVLGASVQQIVTLLSRDFIRLIIIAFVLAAPISWYAMDRWLANFAYHTEVSWHVFVVTGIVVVALAFLTMSVQVIRAALSNPANSLRNNE
ncbi:ABC transporter permease [Fulvivirgaceae bacterium PWU5]|uniref:ABC transporter permease n=1 Tax=Dawidia cretensis TaxID=2782350 RepID=A0AAP2E2T1_9BACT|nr:ABC transporter permease [Dawidia cretensis]MBT1710657.1 ABC transporter permease [Dawidia cretensis]